ncbi:MAG: hypothetical protein JNK77_17350 [Saprospiraceae bacterium]|nr:hypothetical protein [Saprospiraceae bacterium]
MKNLLFPLCFLLCMYSFSAYGQYTTRLYAGLNSSILTNAQDEPQSGLGGGNNDYKSQERSGIGGELGIAMDVPVSGRLTIIWGADILATRSSFYQESSFWILYCGTVDRQMGRVRLGKIDLSLPLRLGINTWRNIRVEPEIRYNIQLVNFSRWNYHDIVYCVHNSDPMGQPYIPLATPVEKDGQIDYELKKQGTLSAGLFVFIPISQRWGVHAGARQLLTKMHEYPAFRSLQLALRVAYRL